jgi:hypothetical protein
VTRFSPAASRGNQILKRAEWLDVGLIGLTHQKKLTRSTTDLNFERHPRDSGKPGVSRRSSSTKRNSNRLVSGTNPV